MFQRPLRSTPPGCCALTDERQTVEARITPDARLCDPVLIVAQQRRARRLSEIEASTGSVISESKAVQADERKPLLSPIILRVVHIICNFPWPRANYRVRIVDKGFAPCIRHRQCARKPCPPRKRMAVVYPVRDWLTPTLGMQAHIIMCSQFSRRVQGVFTTNYPTARSSSRVYFVLRTQPST